MGPLPKRKISKSRRNRRRAHDALDPEPTLSSVKVAASTILRIVFAQNVALIAAKSSSKLSKSKQAC